MAFDLRFLRLIIVKSFFAILLLRWQNLLILLIYLLDIGALRSLIMWAAYQMYQTIVTLALSLFELMDLPF